MLPSAALRSNLGTDVLRLDRGDASLIVPQAGIAVLILRSRQAEIFSQTRPFSAMVLCARRQERHRLVLEGVEQAIGFNLAELVGAMRAELARSTPHRQRRDYDPRILHYAMSTYFVGPASINLLNRHDRKHITACLDPSIIDMSDTPFEMENVVWPASLKNQLPQLDRAVESVADRVDEFVVAHSKENAVLASWSSVIVVGAIDDAERELVTALQARVQTSWLAAWTVQDIGSRLMKRSGRVSRRVLDWQAVELNQLRRLGRRHIDASESERVRTMLAGFEKTSGLQREWELAQEALDDAREYADLVTNDVNYRSHTAVEVFIWLFSVTSLGQIILKLPIQSWTDVLSQWPQSLLLFVLLLIGFSLILTRRR